MRRYPSSYASSFSFGPGPISTALKTLIAANVAMFLVAQFAPVNLNAILGLVPKLTLRQHMMTPADLEGLRQHGFDDRAIHDAVQVIGYFNYITRVADALGVEREDFIQPWGEQD